MKTLQQTMPERQFQNQSIEINSRPGNIWGNAQEEGIILVFLMKKLIFPIYLTKYTSFFLLSNTSEFTTVTKKVLQ